MTYLSPSLFFTIQHSQGTPHRKNMIRAVCHKPKTLTRMKFNNLLYVTAAAAFSTSARAWSVTPAPVHLQHRKTILLPRTSFRNQDRNSGTRLYFSSSRKDDGDEGLFSIVGNAVKSALPTKWFGSDEEKQKLQRRQEMKDQVTGGLDQVFKDAPLPIKMMGKVVGPLMGNLMSTLAETVADQQRTMEALLEEAQGYLIADPVVVDTLGEGIRLGTPFSQSSSTTSINGKTQSRVELALPVSGNRASGVAKLLATQDGISQILVEAGGRAINVSLTFSQRGPGFSSFSSPSNNDNVIEAQIIDKKETK